MRTIRGYTVQIKKAQKSKFYFIQKQHYRMEKSVTINRKKM